MSKPYAGHPKYTVEFMAWSYNAKYHLIKHSTFNEGSGLESQMVSQHETLEEAIKAMGQWTMGKIVLAASEQTVDNT